MIYFDKDGKPIDLFEWAKKFEDLSYKVIEQTELRNGLWVSTVWLGLNHCYSEGEPLIFETMVFKNKEIGKELDMDRYNTLEEAKEGHKKMVAKYDDYGLPLACWV